MIRVQILAEFPEDDLGPAESYWEDFILAPSFASSPSEAHQKILRLIALEDHFELPQEHRAGVIPLNSFTIRAILVW